MISQTILNEMIENHKKWLNNNKEGKQFMLAGENISELDFGEAILDRAIISNCFIKKCCLQKVSFEKASMAFTSFVSCEINGANFNNAILKMITFDRNEMIGTKFIDTYIADSNIVYNSLSGADFSLTEEINENEDFNNRMQIFNTNFVKNIFTGCKFTNRILNKNRLIDFSGCIFNGCDFNNCDFSDIDFLECSFSHSSVHLTNFNSCNFSKTKFQSVNFEDCSLINCIGNNKEIITVQAHLFLCVISPKILYIGKTFYPIKEWFSKNDEEIIKELVENSENSEEIVEKWWKIWKPILSKICLENVDI